MTWLKICFAKFEDHIYGVCGPVVSLVFEDCNPNISEGNAQRFSFTVSALFSLGVSSLQSKEGRD